MKASEIKEVLREFDQRCDTYSYTKDSYCLQLLRYCHGNRARIADIKRSPLKGLLDKPAIKVLSARHGDGRIDLTKAAVTGARNFDFRLSYSLWKGKSQWDQVSRLGWQLVLQLNFPEQHDLVYLEKVKPKDFGPFAYCGHPVRYRGLQTLAWARIDLDPLCGQALIEEVQNDWLRAAGWFVRSARTYKGRRGMRRSMKNDHHEDAVLEQVLSYIKEDLQPYTKIWQEALLSACLWLLVEQMGYHCVYMHSWDTGRVLKLCEPPRSLYSQLPRKFCMRRVQYAPAMVLTQARAKRALRTLQQPYWFQHRFGERYRGHA